MALGPRLDLRQTQTLVMTPQLRQAIKLLQYLQPRGGELRRGGAGAESAARARRQRRSCRTPSVPHPIRCRSGSARPPMRRSWRSGRHAADRDGRAARCRSWRDLRRRRRRRRCAIQLGDRRPRRCDADFDTDERGIDDFADERRSLREYLGEQLRLSFDDPVDRMIGAHLIALLCPAGRLTADPAAIADAMAIPLRARRGGARAHDAVRSGRAVRARSEGMPCRAACRAQPARSGDGGAARQSRSAGAAGTAAADGGLRRRCRGPCRDDRRDPQPRSEAGGELRLGAGASWSSPTS